MTSRYRGFTYSEGYTLIELLVVITILTLAMTLTGSMTLESVTRARVDAEVKQLEGWISKWSATAALHSVPVEIHAVNDNLKIVINGDIVDERRLILLKCAAGHEVVSVSSAGIANKEFLHLETESALREIWIKGPFASYVNSEEQRL